MEIARSGFAKWLIIIMLCLAFFVSMLVYLGRQGPGTRVLSGKQTPARFVGQIRSLGVLEPDEQINYFYSDAFLNIEEGFYLVTDRKVVVYSEDFVDPAIVIPYEDISRVDANYSNSWVRDSLITLTLVDGFDVSFPASPEGGGDKRMVEAINNKIGNAVDDEPPSTLSSPDP